MSGIAIKEKLVELRDVIGAMQIPLEYTVRSSVDERAKEVADILSCFDPIAEFFALNRKENASLHGLHICRWIAQNIWVAATENWIYWHDYDEVFINSVLDIYTKELDETLELI